VRRQLKVLLLYLAAIVGAYGAGHDLPVFVLLGGAMWMTVDHL
jgi:hypothetical protein